jgi:hypothetical protein
MNTNDTVSNQLRKYTLQSENRQVGIDLLKPLEVVDTVTGETHAARLLSIKPHANGDIIVVSTQSTVRHFVRASGLLLIRDLKTGKYSPCGAACTSVLRNTVSDLPRLDVCKPCRTRDGREVTYLGPSLIPGMTHVFDCCDGYEYNCTKFGEMEAGAESFDDIVQAKKISGFMNVYRSAVYATREEAKENRASNAVATIEVDRWEGDGIA